MFTFLKSNSFEKPKYVDDDLCYCLVRFKKDGVELVNNAIFSNRELLEKYIENYIYPDDVSVLPLIFYYDYEIYDEDDEDEDDE